MKNRTQSFDPRQVMRSQTFEVFHYHDPKPNSVEMHHHDFYEVYLFLGGNVQYRVEGRLYRLEPGDMLLISPTELHQPIMEEGADAYERIVLWINRAYLESFSTADTSLTRCFDNGIPGHSNHLRLSPSQRTDFLLRLNELVRESYGRDYAARLCAEGIFLQFMAQLNRLAPGSSAATEKGEASALVTDVLEYISAHYNEELSLDSLSQKFYVSKYHLSHEFSRAVGTGLHRYITLKRLMIARQLLTGGVAPGTVCSHCGFGDYANFYRAFKARYGISPRDCAADEQTLPALAAD